MNISGRFCNLWLFFYGLLLYHCSPSITSHINPKSQISDWVKKFELDFESSILLHLLDFKVFVSSPLTLERQIGVPRILARNLSIGSFSPSRKWPTMPKPKETSSFWEVDFLRHLMIFGTEWKCTVAKKSYCKPPILGNLSIHQKCLLTSLFCKHALWGRSWNS